MTSSIPLPVDYTTSPYTYSHDAVFQQMLLRGAHVFPPASTLLFRADNMTSRPITEPRTRRPSIVSSFTTRNQAYDSEVDDGYYADRDNEPKRLVAVMSDFLLEITPMTTKKSRCYACHTELRPSSYRLRSADTHDSFHLPCFESHFNIEQGFGYVYPSPPSNLGDSRLDDAARQLVNAWKIQRRREGLADAAGPDSGIAAMECYEPYETVQVGQKRGSAEVEDDYERKRTKFARRQTDPASSSSSSSSYSESQMDHRAIRSHRSGSLGGGRGKGCSSDPNERFVNLPMKLSEALRRLEGIPRTFLGATTTASS